MQKLYKTEFLIERFFKELESNKKNKKEITIDKLIIKNIDKKSYFINFDKICKTIKRDKNHVKSFLENSLNILSSINDDDILKFDGTLKLSQIEDAFKSYITSYVKCSEPLCGSYNTEIKKHNKVNILYCNVCNSKKTLK